MEPEKTFIESVPDKRHLYRHRVIWREASAVHDPFMSAERTQPHSYSPEHCSAWIMLTPHCFILWRTLHELRMLLHWASFLTKCMLWSKDRPSMEEPFSSRCLLNPLVLVQMNSKTRTAKSQVLASIQQLASVRILGRGRSLASSSARERIIQSRTVIVAWSLLQGRISLERHPCQRMIL
jgi:hypothetical protein